MIFRDMKMIRVLHIIGKMDRAGAETMLMNLYRHIDLSQIQFDFVTFTNEEGDYDAEIIKLGGKIIPILANNPIERMFKLQRFLKQNPKYKIVHAHTLLSNAFHLLAAKGANVKHRISHSHSISNDKSSRLDKLYEKWATITNKHVANQKIACGDLAAHYLFDTSQDVWLLPNAIDIASTMKIASQSRNYIEKKFNNKGLKIIQVGRLNKVKNHIFSINIAEELEQRGIEFTMYFIGQGPLEIDLKQEVENRLLENRVKFLGVRSDITELMASADYMIFPSLFEGFGVVLVESQAVGLTAIASNYVPKEADFGLGLVDFLSLDSVNNWVDHILMMEVSTPNDTKISNVLKERGFNAAINAQELSKFYKSL